MQKLPIGIQDFAKLRSNGFMYIDKTEKIFEMVEGAGYYFLSRPRRFGKSLLVSTLKEIFSGNKEHFKDLWIENKIEWKKYPVVHLSFAISGYREMGLVNYLLKKLSQVAKEHQIEIKSTTVAFALEELIIELYKKYNQEVVLLIDEYDKPIIDFLGKDEIHIAEEHRKIMKDFYSPIKDLGTYLRFFFLTGVSKFSKVSIFSDLNNLIDLTLNPLGATLLGYTQNELEHYFAAHIENISSVKQISEEELKKEIKEWYNGYSFGDEKLYNPFSIINFMTDKKFNNYWFETGTPTFLVKLVVEDGQYDIQNVEVSLSSLGKFEISNLSPITLLFQTGYLTIKEHLIDDMYRLDYPNREVQRSTNQLLLAEYAQKETTETTGLLYRIKKSFDDNDLESVFNYLNALFADIPYQIFETKRESYYHSIIYLTFKLLGYYTSSEVSTSKGRIDAVVQTENTIYVLEFKVNDTAQNALAQIKEKKYAEKYTSENKNIVLIGVACNQKTIKEYLIEML